MAEELPPAGWYDDPEQDGAQRYWDGASWTEERRAESAAPLPPPTTPGGHTAKASESKPKGKIPLFGARGKARELQAEADELRGQLERNGGLALMEAERRRDEALREAEEANAASAAAREEQEARLAELRQEVVLTEDAAVLQEVGVYEYRHPLDDAVAYQAELKRLKDLIRAMNKKHGGAVVGTTNWTVNNSAPQGRKMVRDFSKLMLRAYNAEADNLVRSLKPYKVESSIVRLTKVATTIVKLGGTMDIRITDNYHGVRIKELELTADYLEKKAEEKEREREEKARLREEKKAQQEMERERKRLEKERTHHENALAALEAKGDDEAATRLRAELEEISKAIEDVDYRVANVRAGYVYIISNIGSFGQRMIKIGMTRRLEPRDRVRELSDASVPFNFDVHALFFAQDAVEIEAELHRRLADKRVNKVNRRREFFYATPEEVREQLLDVAGDILEFDPVPEAIEFHQSVNDGEAMGVVGAEGQVGSGPGGR